MLSSDQLELITAAVDGELSATEARAFRRLLDRSPEARELYAKLKLDSERVRALPQATPPADLRAKILARVASLTPVPTPAQNGKTSKTQPAAKPLSSSLPRPHTAGSPESPPVQPAQPAQTAQPAQLVQPVALRRTPAWVPAAMAASLLLGVAAFSFAYFKRPAGSQQSDAQNPWANALPAPQAQPAAVPSPTATLPPERPHADPHAVVRVDVSPVPPPRAVKHPPLEIAPEPRPAEHNLIASPILPKIPPFDLVQVRLPFLRTVAELDREDTRQELTDELASEAPFRIDLFVRDPARGAEVFQRAAKAAGITVFADAATLEKLKKRQVHAVVVYVECLTPAELTALFAKIAAEDTKFSPRVCDSLHAVPIVRADEHELKLVFGIDVGLYKRPRGASGTGNAGANGATGANGAAPKLVDQNGNPQSVSAGTIGSVTKTLTSPPPKPIDKAAMLTTWQTTHGNIPRTAPSTSDELKQFLATRAERKPKAVPTIIIIRTHG